MALLVREQSLEAPDFFLTGFEGSLDDGGLEPWSATDLPYGTHVPGHIKVRVALSGHACAAKLLTRFSASLHLTTP